MVPTARVRDSFAPKGLEGLMRWFKAEGARGARLKTKGALPHLPWCWWPLGGRLVASVIKWEALDLRVIGASRQVGM